VIEGQINLRDAVSRTITHVNPDGKTYRLNEKTSVLFVRPRGLHMVEKHMTVDGKPVMHLARRPRVDDDGTRQRPTWCASTCDLPDLSRSKL